MSKKNHATTKAGWDNVIECRRRIQEHDGFTPGVIKANEILEHADPLIQRFCSGLATGKDIKKSLKLLTQLKAIGGCRCDKPTHGFKYTNGDNA